MSCTTIILNRSLGGFFRIKWVIMSSVPDRTIWRPYTQEKIAPLPVVIDRAEGSYLFTKDGKKIFDGISSWWVITHGHCHPRIVEAIQRQASRIDQIIFANFSH